LWRDSHMLWVSSIVHDYIKKKNLSQLIIVYPESCSFNEPSKQQLTPNVRRRVRCRRINNQNKIHLPSLRRSTEGIPNSNTNCSHVHRDTNMYALRERERERDYTRETKEFPARQFAPDRWYRDGWTRDEPAFVSNRIFFVSFFRFFTACSNRIGTSLLEAALRFNTNATADWDRLTGFPRQSTRKPKLSCRRRPL